MLELELYLAPSARVVNILWVAVRCALHAQQGGQPKLVVASAPFAQRGSMLKQNHKLASPATRADTLRLTVASAQIACQGGLRLLEAANAHLA